MLSNNYINVIDVCKLIIFNCCEIKVIVGVRYLIFIKL